MAWAGIGPRTSPSSGHATSARSPRFSAIKTYFTGESACGADATAFAFVAGALSPVFETPVRRATERHANLVAYRDRMMARFYPELAKAA